MKLRLCVMMFLQFFIWGAWYPLAFDFFPSLGFSEWWMVPLILGCFNIAAVAAMLFGNQFADRFAAEKFLALSHLIGGAAMVGMSFLKMPEGAEAAPPWLFWAFFGTMFVHTMAYVPTISITNAIAFANLKDPAREFGIVRLFGTIGWIAAAWPFVFVLVDWVNVPNLGQEAALLKDDAGKVVKVVPLTDANRKDMEEKKGEFEKHSAEVVKTDYLTWFKTALGTPLKGKAFRDGTSYTFLAAGIASLLLAAFSLILPHTPPKPSGEPFPLLGAVKLLVKPFVFVLFIVTFIDAAVHQAYFRWAASFYQKGVHLPGNWVMPVMSIGQVAEIGTMAILGFVLKTFGWRMTMTVGILGHAARFALFAFADQLPAAYQQPAAIGINVLHGICYAFFFATLYIFIDEYFPKDARSSAQGLFNMLILGVGPFVSNYLSEILANQFAIARDANGKYTDVDFNLLFLFPTAAAIIAAVLLLLFFHPPKKADGVPT